MKITISPVKKNALMAGLCIVFFVIIHFVIVPFLECLSIAKLSTAFLLTVSILVSIALFALITYARMYRPLVPGPSSWKQDDFWNLMEIEKSMAGYIKFAYWVAKLFIFTVVLYAVLKHIVGLYQKNLPEIMSGTWEYDKMEAAFMAAPLIMIFFLLLHFGVILYEHFTLEKKK